MKTRKSVLSTLIMTTALAFGSLQAAETDRYIVSYQLGQKTVLETALPAGAIVHHEFDRIGVIAVTMPVAAATALGNLSVVKSISEDPDYELFAQEIPYGIDMVNARDEWDANRDNSIDPGSATGEGMGVCIVDTGIRTAHEDLGAGGVNIAGGRSFVGEDWFDDRQGHGTHVAGTVAAMHNDYGVVGVSPGTVDLYIADVFNDAGEGQASSTIFAAVDWCAEQEGVDIISMSLGGPLVSELALGYQQVYDDGILIIAAAGNDALPQDNYPASYPSVVSVAAVDANEVVAEFSNFPPNPFGPEVAAPGVAVLSTYPYRNALDVSAGPSYRANRISETGAPGSYTDPLRLPEGDGLCALADAPAPGTYANSIVLCERGAWSFAEKIDHAHAGGATGVIIYNDEARGPGNFNGTYSLEDPPLQGPLPAISLSRTDGLIVRDSHIGQVVTIVVDELSSQGYAEVSGTSMATPHASGVAAVQWSSCPELTNDEMRSHLAFTTRNALGDETPSVRDPFYGYGIVQAKEGVDALRDGIDGYDPVVGNGQGRNPANVECQTDPPPPPPEGPDSSKASGSGYLHRDDEDDDSSDDKIDFSFKAEHKDKDKGLDGKIKLKDKAEEKAGEIKIDVRELTSFKVLAADCGPVPAGNNAVEIKGAGTFNDLPATFRACAADVDKKGKGNDLFYLECQSGCVYNTTAAGSNGVLGGGNVKVYMVDEDGETEATAESGEESTIDLGPMLLDYATAGALQAFIATVYDDAQAPMAGASVTLLAEHADGSVDAYEATAGPAGEALFSVVLPDGDVRYRAVSGSAESNRVVLSPAD